jgi:diaminopimelate decarboxylase
MSCLSYREHELYIEDVRLSTIANEFGTPCYVYSREAITRNVRAFNEAFTDLPHHLCYAVKANSNIAILQLLADLGTGFDIVSAGELKRVVAAGGATNKIIFSGVGKSREDIELAIKFGIFCFNIESEPELDRIADIADQLNQTVNIMLRVNPDVDAKTHSYISTGLRENKFGMNLTDILPLFAKIQRTPALRLIGIGAHIGSQITELPPFLLSLDHLLGIYQSLKEQGIVIEYINIGGGLGITYRDETPPSVKEYAEVIKHKLSHYPLKLILEPGRSIVGNAGILLTKIEYLKDNGTRHFAITDAGMNDLMRPALYNAWQNILPVKQRDLPLKEYDVTGPVCESADFLGKARQLAIAPNDLLAVDGAGAYGFSMSSTYNSRPRPPEILVDGKTTYLIRRRETIEDAISLEQLVSE